LKLIANKYTCIIIDDEPDGREVLEILISKLPDLSILKTFNNAFDALKFVNEVSPDIVFLDINMPEINGIEFMQLLGSKKLNVVFTTAYSHYAEKVFDFNTIDYLVKPIALDKLVRAIERAIARINPEQSYGIFLKKDRDHLIWLDFTDIIYLEADGNYVKFYLKSSENFLHFRISLHETLEVLPYMNFTQVNRSTIVSMNEISELNGATIVLKNRKKLTYTPSFKENLKLKISSRTLGH